MSSLAGLVDMLLAFIIRAFPVGISTDAHIRCTQVYTFVVTDAARTVVVHSVSDIATSELVFDLASQRRNRPKC